jgi:hypothetical protein
MISLSQGDLAKARFTTAQASASSNGGCVAVATNLPGVTVVRDSTRPAAGVHVVSTQAWTAFLDDVNAGAFDLRSGQ